MADSHVVHWAGWLLCLSALLLYLATLDTGLRPGELAGGDLITHQYAQVEARPGNAPGYPLYTLGGWFWFHALRTLARGLGYSQPNPIPLLSSYSTLWAVLALWLFYRILCQLTRSPAWPAGNWPLAWLLSAFYAVTFFFWYYATTTEQYSSAVAQTLGIVYVYLLWREASGAPSGHPRVASGEWHTQRRSTSGDLVNDIGSFSASNVVNKTTRNTQHATRHLLLLAFLCGLALAHMLTVALIVPPLVLVILWQAPGLLRSLRVISGVLVAASLPLISYLYIYIRGAQHPEWWGAGEWRNAQEWFWAFLSTAQGREELGWGFEAGRNLWRGVQFPELIGQELTIPLLILGLIGIACLGRNVAVLLYATLALYLAFCWAYRYGNWYQVILPAYPLVLLGVGGSVKLAEMIIGRIGKPPLRDSVLRVACCVGLVVLGIGVLWRFWTVLPAADSRNRPDDTAFERAALLLAQPLPAHAALFASVEDALALQYLAQIWQVRPDLAVVSSPTAANLLAAGQPVFATWQSAALLYSELPPNLAVTRQSATPDWLIFQTGDSQQPLTQPAVQISQVITPGVTLVGYTVQAASIPMPQPITPTLALDLLLFWQITGDWPPNLAISVRPTRQGAFLPDPAQPDRIIQEDRSRPAHDLLLLPVGAPESLVADGYRLALPDPLPAGADGVLVILYEKIEGGFRNVAEVSLEIGEES